MNLTSCNQCGVVLDKDKIYFPSVYDPDTCEVIDGNAVWNGETYVSKVECPVCSGVITSEE